MRRAALALVLAVAAAACGSKSDDKPAPGDQGPPPIPKSERDRGIQACTAYVARVCACAKAHPDKAAVVEKCKADDALPEALSMALGVDDTKAAPQDLFHAQSAARQVAATCFQRLNWLAGQGCE